MNRWVVAAASVIMMAALGSFNAWSVFRIPLAEFYVLYANAGHTLPCCRRSAEGRTDELVARGMPLGLMVGMSYEEKETTLLPGDGVLLCTDGFVEAHSPQGEMFGAPRLRGLLSKHPESGTGLRAALMEELERFTGVEWKQEDDITLLTLERSSTLR